MIWTTQMQIMMDSGIFMSSVQASQKSTISKQICKNKIIRTYASEELHMS